MCGDHRDLHVRTHSFPTRRSSDLAFAVGAYDTHSVASRPGSRTPLPPFLRVDPDLCHGRQGRARQDAAATFVNYGSGYYPSYRAALDRAEIKGPEDRKSTRLNSSH